MVKYNESKYNLKSCRKEEKSFRLLEGKPEFSKLFKFTSTI